MKAFASAARAATATLALAGCSAKEDDAPPPPRPVLSIVAQPENLDETGFVGTVQPRYQTDRGFQVLGRIIAYNVDIGDLVKRGDPLAEVDPTTFVLDVRSKEGDLAKARSELRNATLAEQRTQKLVDQKVATPATLDADRQAREADAATVQQAEANLAKSKEQLGYTTITADEDGVVMTKDADVGNTVSVGQKVMTVARTDVREAVVDLPDDLARALKQDTGFRIRLQADPSVEVDGKVRVVAPQADATTRLRRIRITLDRVADVFRLGTTIVATQLESANPAMIEIPVSALLERDGGIRVWVVDEKARTVRTVPVDIASKDDRLARVRTGIVPGTRVVVAGVHSLGEGQTVRLDGETAG